MQEINYSSHKSSNSFYLHIIELKKLTFILVIISTFISLLSFVVRFPKCVLNTYILFYFVFAGANLYFMEKVENELPYASELLFAIIYLLSGVLYFLDFIGFALIGILLGNIVIFFILKKDISAIKKLENHENLPLHFKGVIGKILGNGSLNTIIAVLLTVWFINFFAGYEFVTNLPLISKNIHSHIRSYSFILSPFSGAVIVPFIVFFVCLITSSYRVLKLALFATLLFHVAIPYLYAVDKRILFSVSLFGKGWYLSVSILIFTLILQFSFGLNGKAENNKPTEGS